MASLSILCNKVHFCNFRHYISEISSDLLFILLVKLSLFILKVKFILFQIGKIVILLLFYSDEGASQHELSTISQAIHPFSFAVRLIKD